LGFNYHLQILDTVVPSEPEVLAWYVDGSPFGRIGYRSGQILAPCGFMKNEVCAYSLDVETGATELKSTAQLQAGMVLSVDRSGEVASGRFGMVRLEFGPDGVDMEKGAPFRPGDISEVRVGEGQTVIVGDYRGGLFLFDATVPWSPKLVSHPVTNVGVGSFCVTGTKVYAISPANWHDIVEVDYANQESPTTLNIVNSTTKVTKIACRENALYLSHEGESMITSLVPTGEAWMVADSTVTLHPNPPFPGLDQPVYDMEVVEGGLIALAGDFVYMITTDDSGIFLDNVTVGGIEAQYYAFDLSVHGNRFAVEDLLGIWLGHVGAGGAELVTYLAFDKELTRVGLTDGAVVWGGFGYWARADYDGTTVGLSSTYPLAGDWTMVTGLAGVGDGFYIGTDMDGVLVFGPSPCEE
jgi:hypothetical protein